MVVVGYGTRKVKDATGAVVSLGEKSFNKGVIASPEQLLQGRTAGVNVTNNSGEPGGAVNITIRGTSSVRSNNNPLYVVDGVPLYGGGMTGTGISVEGYKRPPQDMMNMVKAIGVSEVVEVNPSDRYFYQNLLSEVIMKNGVKVIISNKECGLTFHGKKKSQERKIFNQNETLSKQVFYQINTDACVS